jgi:extradiol dioxygenase family protein
MDTLYKSRIPLTKGELMAGICFHLSIPSLDLSATERWYVEGLGCRAGRRSHQALILDFGGHQLVAQLLPGEPPTPQPGIYPRHFGLVMQKLSDWEEIRNRAEARQLVFGVQPKCRFEGTQLEHRTFFLIDPANNWLEFKYYSNPQAILGLTNENFVGDSDLRT